MLLCKTPEETEVFKRFCDRSILDSDACSKTVEAIILEDNFSCREWNRSDERALVSLTGTILILIMELVLSRRM